MISIVEAERNISKLWSIAELKTNEVFRLMRYVIRVDYEDAVLLQNVVTGQLALLESEEKEVIDMLPATYTSAMKSLIENHFLVPNMFDDHRQVSNMRKILWKLTEAQRKKGIRKYTIFPTTACNARCYYCFEQGIRQVTMTEQMANDVVEFISNHHEGERICLSWFGGEPTVAANRIDQISKGIRDKGIDYWSEMTTNGYLFDEEMVKRASDLWKLKSVMICVDGAEEKYNKIKAFVSAKESAYQRVMRNIALLTSKKIAVSLRMNFDLNNYQDFPVLLRDVASRFENNKYFRLSTHPINGEYVDSSGNLMHGTDTWFEEKILAFNNLARAAGFLPQYGKLPSLQFSGCEANSDSCVTITAEGNLVRCPEQFDENQITGNIRDGVTNQQMVDSWKVFSDYPKCRRCLLYPKCNRLVNCNAKERCSFYSEQVFLIKSAMTHYYKLWKKHPVQECYS